MPIAAGNSAHRDPGASQRLHLVRRGALAAGDDGAGVAHAAAGRRGGAGDKADHRLLALGRLRNAAASSSAVPPISPIITIASVSASAWNMLEHVDEVESVDRVAADADAGRLADAGGGGLRHRLVGQGAGARHDADLAGRWMWPGMMPILHSPGVMTPGQFGPISVRPGAVEGALDAHHVEDRACPR